MTKSNFKKKKECVFGLKLQRENQEKKERHAAGSQSRRLRSDILTTTGS